MYTYLYICIYTLYINFIYIKLTFNILLIYIILLITFTGNVIYIYIT